MPELVYKKNKAVKKKDITFQLLSLTDGHLSQQVDNDDEDDKESTGKQQLYTINLFGRTAKGKTAYLRVNGFTPYFYVEIPADWRKQDVEKLVDHVKAIVSQNVLAKKKNWDPSKYLKSWNIVTRHRLYGFTNKADFRFLRLIFNNYFAFREFSYAFQKKIKVPGLPRNKQPTKKLQLYESNLEPLLRFLHHRNISGSGWVTTKKYEVLHDKPTNSDINISAKWTDINPEPRDDIAPLINGAFDIECTSCDGTFPQADRIDDKVIQIGCTFSKYGNPNCYDKYLISLKECGKIKDTTVISCTTEKKLLIEFTKLIRRINPDILVGYNIFGFDMPYLYDRAKLLGCLDEFSKLSRFKNKKCLLKEKKLASSALGDNILKYIDMEGYVLIDLMKNIQANQNFRLASYKLDYVVSFFIKEKVEKLEKNRDDELGKVLMLYTKNTSEISVGDYISLTENDGIVENSFREGHKYKILKIDQITVNEDVKNKVVEKDANGEEHTVIKVEKQDVVKHRVWLEYDYRSFNEFNQLISAKHKFSWWQSKDDVHPKDIFRLFNGTAKNRATIGKYCVKDCTLCNLLLEKLQIINNNVAMANVCSVPMTYLFMRGQGIKGTSLVSRYCQEQEYVIKTLPKVEPKENEDPEDRKAKYKGATVIEPKIGVYVVPIVVLDFNSLYPSSMIMNNISHETKVTDEKYNNLPDYEYIDIKVDDNDGTQRTVRYAKRKNGEQGIIPQILANLLKERKNVKNAMKNEKDPFKRKILDGKQLALKMTANSIYGLTGAETSTMADPDLAASTTATGRDMLYTAKSVVESKEFNGKVRYGDTDSIFVEFPMKDKKTKKILQGREAVMKAIEYGEKAEKAINKVVRDPQHIEYEKTLYPLILIKKKKYVGNLFEKDPDSSYLKYMGIVLKRRDNAQIVKDVCAGIIDQILNKRDIDGAIKFTKKMITDVLNNKYPLEKFVITKTLRGHYKDPDKIAHKTLADRIAKRDPGNKPLVNDRIPYVYIQVKGDTSEMLQGDLIEHPDYIKENNIPVDYIFYIKHQIMKPAVQFIELLRPNPERLFNEFIDIETKRRLGKKASKITNWVKITKDEHTNEINERETCVNKIQKKDKRNQATKMKFKTIPTENNPNIQSMAIKKVTRKRNLKKTNVVSYSSSIDMSIGGCRRKPVCVGSLSKICESN